MPFYFNGKTYNLPGAYGFIQVVSSAGSTLPDFNVGLIIADSIKGAPYTSSNKASDIMLAYSDENALINDYGRGTIYNDFMQAKAMGAGTIFVLNAQANTPASGTLLDAATSPAPSVVVKATPKNYGIFGNDAQISIVESASSTLTNAGANQGTATSATSTTLVDTTKTWVVDCIKTKWVKIESGTGAGQTRKITANTATTLTVSAWTTTPDTTSVYSIYEPKFTVSLTPTKNERVIVRNVTSGDKYIYVNDIDGLSVGATFDIYTNASPLKVGTYTIVGIDPNYNKTYKAYKIMTAESISSSAVTTTNYARITALDTDNTISINFENNEYTLDNFVQKMNDNQTEYVFSIASAATLPPASLASSSIAGLTTPTLGTNPTCGTGDYTNIAAMFPDWQREFVTTNKISIRLILLGTPDSSIIAVYKNLSMTMADNINKKPIVIVAGTDFVTTNSDLISKAKALNTGRVCLCAGGIDGLPAYLSFAPQVFGIRLANPITYKLTNVLVNCTKPEKEWTYDDMVQLVKNGLVIFSATETGYRIKQGLTTYQDQVRQWNRNDNDTYLIRQRDLADFFHIGIVRGMERDNINKFDVSKSDLMTWLIAAVQPYLADGYISDYKIASITSVDSGWIITHDLRLPEDKDFIGIITRINI